MFLTVKSVIQFWFHLFCTNISNSDFIYLACVLKTSCESFIYIVLFCLITGEAFKNLSKVSSKKEEGF